jgi:hypothetical protein
MNKELEQAAKEEKSSNKAVTKYNAEVNKDAEAIMLKYIPNGVINLKPSGPKVGYVTERRAIIAAMEEYAGHAYALAETKGLRWVKASERLPVKTMPVIFRVDGVNCVGSFFKKGTSDAIVTDRFYSRSGKCNYYPYFIGIEWFDESTTASEDKGKDSVKFLTDTLLLIDRYRNELGDKDNSCANHVYNNIRERLSDLGNLTASEGDAVAFAEWASRNRWEYNNARKCWHRRDHMEYISGYQLYQLFKQSKNE